MAVPDNYPRISFGVIVLNGEPFTKYCLRQLYPHAHQIIVVEGGSRKAATFAPDGRSTDGTLNALYEFKAQEDLDDKVIIITKDGFWTEKDEQSRAYAECATGDYLWQVDIDEFYRYEDIEKVRTMLAEDPSIDTVSFKQFVFWGSPNIISDSFSQRANRCDEYHRLFKWGAGYSYKTHRPPTVLDDRGLNLRKKYWVRSQTTKKMGVLLFHYSLLFPIQVRTKCLYYATPIDNSGRHCVPRIIDWAENSFFALKRPFRVHNVFKNISWLKRYSGNHPEEALRMWEDACRKKIDVETRNNRDVENLLNNPFYYYSAAVLSAAAGILKYPPMNYFRRAYFSIPYRLSVLLNSMKQYLAKRVC